MRDDEIDMLENVLESQIRSWNVIGWIDLVLGGAFVAWGVHDSVQGATRWSDVLTAVIGGALLFGGLRLLGINRSRSGLLRFVRELRAMGTIDPEKVTLH